MKNIVHLCDCMDFLRNLPDKVYDLAIVDPPYGIGNFIPQSGKRPNNYNAYVKWNDKIPNRNYFDALERVSKCQIIWGANYYNNFESGSAIVWYKHTKNPNFSKCEIAAVNNFGLKKVEYFDHQWLNIVREEITIHPCQKPIALYKWLLQNYAKLGQTIFDSHVGSGSIRIACHDMGFDFEGCEIDPDYWQAQEQRYKIHIAQPEIFEKKEIFEQANLM
jgi:site-specific DNA-methyltransferase (adenine-specific)